MKIDSGFPSPQDLGLPGKYKAWRAHQVEAIKAIDEGNKPVIGLLLPPGAGKTGIYFGWAVWRKKRVVFLAPSKMLQDQIYADFKSLGIMDLRGQSSYTCAITQGPVSDAPCHGGYECPVKNECEYFAELKRAPSEQFILTNPAFWLHNKQLLGNFDALVCDEAHQAFDQLSNHISISFKTRDIKEYFHAAPTSDWKDWASYQRSMFNTQLRRLKDVKAKTEEVFEETRIVKRFAEKVGYLCDADPKTLIYQKTFSGFTWDCVWPGAYRKMLTCNAKKYIFTSGTMTRKTLSMLGYKAEDYTWAEFPSVFSVKRCPVQILPSPRINAHSSDSQLRLWLEVIDKYIDSRKDRRGLVHAGSYVRTEHLALNSRHEKRMIAHTNSKGIPEALERFMAARNSIIVSPSLTEGASFDYEMARFQIIAKLFFPDPRDPVVAERTRQDPEYPWYTTAQKVMQARGRLMRAEDDFGETAIADGSWEWFFPRAKHHFTRYFIDAITQYNVVPRAVPINENPFIIDEPAKPAPVVKKMLDVKVTLSALSASQSPYFTESKPRSKKA